MGKAKAKGTKRETWLKGLAVERGLPARRSENNLAGRDVDIESGVFVAVEVKDRQNLNVHKTLAKTIKGWPRLMPAVVWHRTSKAEGQVKASPDGPTIAAIPVDDWLDLLAVLRHATALQGYSAYDGPVDLRSIETARDALFEAVDRIADRYADHDPTEVPF